MRRALPGSGLGLMVGDNAARGHELSCLAFEAYGDLAAAALSGKASVVPITLALNNVTPTVGAGYCPSRIAFSRTNLLVTDAAAAPSR